MTEPIAHIPNTCAGYVAAFQSQHGRLPTHQDIWDGAIRSYCNRTPPAVAGEPVEWIGASSHHLLQPTQAQAGAVPLTRYRVLEPRVDRIEADDEYLQDDAQTWETDPNGTFVGTIYGYALRAARRRIKGADHG